MSYFFSPINLSINQNVEIAGDEARHVLLAHRAKKGERVKLQGPDRKRFLAEILSAGKGVVRLVVKNEIKVPKEYQAQIILFQAVLAEKALDFIFQKGTELGLSKVVLFNSQNTAVKLTKEKNDSKKDRWEKILQEAAKQSERAVWPELEFVEDLESVVKQMEQIDKLFLTDISGEKQVSLSQNIKTIGVVVGPEGGLTEQEVAQISTLPNCKKINLGPILLRAETASLASIAIIKNFSK